jgi:hypothetical protein
MTTHQRRNRRGRLIESPSFRAVRRLFTEVLPEVGKPRDHQLTRTLLIHAWQNHNTLLLPPSTENLPALREAAVNQALLVAELWDRHCLPLIRVRHGLSVSFMGLYAAMISRVSENAAREPGYDSVDVISGLKRHAFSLFTTLTRDLESLSQLHLDLHTAADYLVYLAFACDHWKL